MPAAMPARAYISPVERSLASYEEKLSRYKRMISRARMMTVDDYIGALKYWDEEVEPAAQAVRQAMVEMHHEKSS